MGLKLPLETANLEKAESRTQADTNHLFDEVGTARPPLAKPESTTLPDGFPVAQSHSEQIIFAPQDQSGTTSEAPSRSTETKLSKEEVALKVKVFMDSRAARTDKALQTEVSPSKEACNDLVDELKRDNPAGNPLMSHVAKESDPDVSRYMFKQPNEGNPFAGADGPTHIKSMAEGEMRPGLYGQRQLSLETERERRADASGSEMLDKPDYFKDMQTVFGNSKYFDLVRNHNQVLSTAGGRTPFMSTRDELMARGEKENLDAATSAIQEKPNEPTVLFNFDSHSDMWAGAVDKGQESIAQWVNGVLRDNPNINEVYWVIPQDFKDNPELSKHYFENTNPANHDHVFVYAKNDMKLFLDRQSGNLHMSRPEDFSDEKYREVELHKRTLDELPDFQGRRTAVSIDLDFFDNRGYDTAFSGSVNYSGEEGFAKFVQTLKDKNVRPDFTTVSASPEYVRDEHMRDLLRFSTMVAEASEAKMDEVAVPKENQVYAALAHDGKQVDRRGVKALELFDELFKIDAQTKTPTDSLDLNLSGAKLDKAIAATKRVYGVDDEEALRILRKLDASDGKQNGVLEFEAMESLLVRVCRVNPDTRPLIKDPGGTTGRDG